MEQADVRLGIGVPRALHVGAAQLKELAITADELRFDSLWVTDHLSDPTPEPLVALAMLAGVTSRIRLGTSVLVVPGRNPAVLAKTMASLDRLSDGRFLPIAGLGRSTAQATSVRLPQRGAVMDEVIPLLRQLWAGDPVTFTGSTFSCHDLVVGPTPVRGGIDLWLAGEHPRQLRRAGRLADGWLGSFLSPEEAGAARVEVLATATRSGREFELDHFGVVVFYGAAGDRVTTDRRPDLLPGDVSARTPDELADLLRRFAQRGISKFIVMPTGPVPDWPTLLQRWRDEILPLQATLKADISNPAARRLEDGPGAPLT